VWARLKNADGACRMLNKLLRGEMRRALGDKT
jgi:hypothetical protein